MQIRIMKYWLSVIMAVILLSGIQISVKANMVASADRYQVIRQPDSSAGTGGSSSSGGSVSGGGGGGSNYTGGGNNSGGNSGGGVTVPSNVKLNFTSMKVWRGDMFTLSLNNASKSGVSWTASNSAVRLKKKQNKVEVYYRKAGTCYVRAKYKGKTFSCKVVCVNKLDPNTMTVDSHGPIDLDCSSSSADDYIMVVSYYRNDGSTISFEVEDPSVAICAWGAGWFGKYNDKTYLFIGGLRPGTTRIKIYNNYNKEKEYITVRVSSKYGSPLIERDSNYDPLSEYG